MNKLSTFLVVVISILLGFAAGYKIGDMRGFQDGYEYGYTFDCRHEIKSLKAIHDDLKKAVDFAERKSDQVQVENLRLRERQRRLEQNPNLVQDSVNNSVRVKFVNDSLDRMFRDGKMKGFRPHVDPYTGKVNTTMSDALNGVNK